MYLSIVGNLYDQSFIQAFSEFKALRKPSYRIYYPYVDLIQMNNRIKIIFVFFVKHVRKS